MEVFLLQDKRSASVHRKHCKFSCLFLPTAEEKALIKFFGDDYVKYRSEVGTKIPFIP
jgi:hypothetical protein